MSEIKSKYSKHPLRKWFITQSLDFPLRTILISLIATIFLGSGIRFFIIDDASISLNRIDHYCNMFNSKYSTFTMGVVDYINIVKYEDQKDWKSQIAIAEALKLMSRKYDITMFSPYQIDAGGEARFAKGILDSADRGFNFFPPNENDDPNRIIVHTTKIRNGRAMNFDIGMDWECTKVVSADSKLISEKPLGISK